MMHNPINKMIMQEIGLTVDKYNKVYDQDTREEIRFKDKTIKYSSTNNVSLGNNDMLFDPASNKSLMTSLFGHYTHKIEEEEGIYIPVHYEEERDDGKVAIAMQIEDKLVKTNAYNNSSLGYLEAVKILNGEENVDLHEYDIIEEKKKQTKRKKKSILP